MDQRQNISVERSGLSWRLQCVVFPLAAVAVVARRPDVISNPQFYSEDGLVWYSDAYNLGWLHALAIPAGGYLNSLQRLIASLALLIPLRHAPLFMNCFGILIQILPVFFLLSGRCSNWWPLRLRMVQAAIYILIPNASEVHVVVTNAPFHFALLAFLVALARPPVTWQWKVFDLVVLTVSPLSGPFCIFLLPLVLVYWWARRERWSLVVAAILTPLICIQGTELLSGGFSSRAPQTLGASFILFLRLLSGQVYVGSIHGQNGFALTAGVLPVVMVTLAGTSVLVYAFWKSMLELRLFISFSMLLFGAALTRPLISGAQPLWQLLAIDRGARYWFFPMLAFLWSLLWCAAQREARAFRLVGIASLVAMLNGVVRDRRYLPLPDRHFQKYVDEFNAAPSGTQIGIPVFPDGKLMRLQKH